MIRFGSIFQQIGGQGQEGSGAGTGATAVVTTPAPAQAQPTPATPEGAAPASGMSLSGDGLQAIFRAEGTVQGYYNDAGGNCT